MEKETVYVENVKQDIKDKCFRDIKMMLILFVLFLPFLFVFLVLYEEDKTFLIGIIALSALIIIPLLLYYIRYRLIIKNFYIVKAKFKGLQYFPYFGELTLGMRFLGYRFYRMVGYKKDVATYDSTLFHYKWSKLGHISEYGIKRSSDQGDIFYLAIYKRKIYALYNTDLFEMHESVKIVDEYGLKY